MSRPSPFPPIPSLAFSKGSALLPASELLEAFILPKKERESSFKLRLRTAGSVVESSPGLADSNSWSPPVITIVGTREKLETWLRESGPGSSCLWVQMEDSSVDSRRKTASGQLKLSYRFRSEQSVTLPLFGETLLELSAKEGFKRITKKSVHEILHPGDSDMGSLRSVHDAHGNSCGIVGPKPGNSSGLEWKSLGVADKDKTISFLMPEKAYRQLLQMVSPGGVLREYQSLLRRTAENANFLDLDFQLVDLHKWLRQHPFAVFWEETDVVIVRKEADRLKWTLLRFDFEGGMIRSTQGATLFALEVTFGNKTISEICASRKNWRGDPADCGVICKAKEKELEEVRSTLEWKIWKSVSSGQKCASVSPLTLILIDILGSSATVSAAEIESVKFLFNSDPYERSIHEQEAADISAIQTIFTCSRRKGLSSKERHALADLRNDRQDLRSEGIRTLLDLLLGVGDGPTSSVRSQVFIPSESPPSHSNPDTSRSSSTAWLHSDQEDIQPSPRTQPRKEHMYGEGAEIKGTNHGAAVEVEKKHQTVRVKENNQVDCGVESPQVAGRTDTARRTSESRCRCGQHPKEDDVMHEVGVMQISEWVKCGFLEFLVEKLLARFRGVTNQDDKLGKSMQFSFDRVLDACVKVMELLPGEGTSRMVSLILRLVHELSEVIAKLSCIDDNVRGAREEAQKISSHEASKDMCILVDEKSSSDANNLQETLVKALRFSRLLFAVITRSSLLAGSLTASGGLDLILDFYSCLLKTFPVNLRLGAKSADSTCCGEGVIPGEVLSGQVAPLRVLPCIFPSRYICNFAQLCLTDSCTYPLKEKVNLTWLAAASESSSNLKVFMNDPEKDIRGGQDADGTWNNQVERLITMTCNPMSLSREPVGRGSTSGGNLNPESLDTGVVEENELESSLLFSDYRFDSSRVRPDIDGPKNPEIPMLSQQTQSRPYVPRLPLNSIQLSNSRSGLTSATDDVAKGFGEPTYASIAERGQMAYSKRGCSSSHFDILKAVSDVKYELLRSIPTLFASRSLTFMRVRGYLHRKLQGEEDTQLVLRFLPDMIGGFVNTAPDHTLWRTKRILLQVVSLLDKSETCRRTCAPESLSICREEDAECGPRWSGPGPTSNVCRRSVDVLLLELGERLTCLVRHLTEMLTKSEAHEKDASSNQTWLRAGAENCCEPSVVTQTFYSGHMLSLWVDVGILLKFLGDFVILWPEEGSARLLLKSCGKPIERVFGLLAKLSCRSDWNLAQILAMQHLFRFSAVCMNTAAHDQGPGSQVWNEVDNFFWQMLIVSDSNWTCVKNFADWVILKSCQGCVRTLLNGYRKVLWEPLGIYYSMIGQKVNPACTQGNDPDSLRGGETLKKSILPLLRASVLLMKKKLKCQYQMSQASPVLYMSRLIFLLDFLMNPVDGLLITVIKAPITSGQQNRRQKGTATSSVANILTSRRVKHHNIFQCTSAPILSANKDSTCMDDTKGLCRKCTMSSSGTTCVQKYTSSMKQECIAILADIFSLKTFEASDEQTNMCINPRAQNPFLFRKYVNPFLEIVFFCFLKCYSDRGEYSERELLLPWFMSPLRQCVSGRYRNSINRVLQRNEPVNSAEESPDCRTLLSKGKNEFITCTVRGNEDETASVACIQYARILLALAQNQTDDVSQGFQQVRVMDFLVQQIGLEYEASQVATPREIIQAGMVNNTPVLSTTSQVQFSREFEAKIPKADHTRREEKPNELSTIRESESNERQLYEKMENDARLELCVSSGTKSLPRGKKSQVHIDPSDSVRSRALSSQVVLLKEESQGDSRRSHFSRRTSKEPTLNIVHELVQGVTCSRKSGCCLGFHSARDTRSTDSENNHSYWVLLDQPLLKFDHAHIKWQKAIAFTSDAHKDLLPFKERNRNTLVDNRILSERGTSSTWTSFQRDKGVNTALSRKFLDKNENDAENLLGSIVPLTVEAKVSCDSLPTAGLCSFEKKVVTNNHIVSQGTQEETPISVSTSTEVKYTGRFFDLNEEVERELAEEELRTSRSQTMEGAESTEDSELLQSDSLRGQRGLRLTLQKDTAVGSGNLQINLETVSTQPEVTRRPDTGKAVKLTSARPAIPKLKLPKSVRKGGQDVISDTSVDLELLLSTTSTQESKGRLNSLLELQREFASDKDGKSWRLGSYETQRLRRRLYRHAGLHVLLLELYIALMLNTHGSDLNHAANSYLLPCLSKRMKDFKPAAYRILKLTWRALFTPLLYRKRVRIGHGAFAHVYTATVRDQTTETEDHVVLKVIDAPKGPHDPCRFFDVFSEVEILERFIGEPKVCQILDYGVEAESFVLVLKHYKCSLRTWRERHGSTSNVEIRRDAGVQQQLFYKTLPLYLEVYSAVLQAVKVLEAENVVHYDLKCDNILLEPLDPSGPESDFWTPVWPPPDATNPLPFRVCIADFGQSKASLYLGGECTVRNRGTEYVKSPEMLKLLSNPSQKGSDSNIRQVGEAVGKAVDVWSLGCLLYELLTGEYLLYDDDWLRFFIRVTVSSEELIPEDKAAKVDNYGPVMDLLRFILVRDPIQRPNLDDLTICVEQLQLKILDQTETNKKNKATDLTSRDLTDVVTDEETESASNSPPSDVQTFESTHVDVHPEKPKQGLHFRDCLMRFNCLFCACICTRE